MTTAQRTREAQLTPNELVLSLSALGRDLEHTVRLLRDADMDATTKRLAADLAESRAFVGAEGSVDMRRHLARIAVEKQEEDALVAESVVRYLRHKINAIGTRIEIGRSLGAALRAELTALPGTGT